MEFQKRGYLVSAGTVTMPLRAFKKTFSENPLGTLFFTIPPLSIMTRPAP